ncbi:hypothetical protein EON66_00245 [archaeon]|nr:MAG: hypothetical protein EON66_00245 [archaeon]
MYAVSMYGRQPKTRLSTHAPTSRASCAAHTQPGMAVTTFTRSLHDCIVTQRPNRAPQTVRPSTVHSSSGEPPVPRFANSFTIAGCTPGTEEYNPRAHTRQRLCASHGRRLLRRHTCRVA